MQGMRKCNAPNRIRSKKNTKHEIRNDTKKRKIFFSKKHQSIQVIQLVIYHDTSIDITFFINISLYVFISLYLYLFISINIYLYVFIRVFQEWAERAIERLTPCTRSPGPRPMCALPSSLRFLVSLGFQPPARSARCPPFSFLSGVVKPPPLPPLRGDGLWIKNWIWCLARICSLIGVCGGRSGSWKCSSSTRKSGNRSI
jgi:hypothetical protein